MAVVFLAVDLFAGDFLAAVFLAVDFLAGALAADDAADDAVDEAFLAPEAGQQAHSRGQVLGALLEVAHVDAEVLELLRHLALDRAHDLFGLSASGLDQLLHRGLGLLHAELACFLHLPHDVLGLGLCHLCEGQSGVDETAIRSLAEFIR